MASSKILFLMADYGHDPTETAVPFSAFQSAGFEISIATETGQSPRCDEKMLSGLTQKLLGADQGAIKLYHQMIASPAFQAPLSWTSPSFSVLAFDVLFFPGGHEKGVRQVIDSSILHKQIAAYFPLTTKPSRKVVAAVCHGVMALSEAKGPGGKSVLYEATTTALPGKMEGFAFWGTRLFLGDYYKTYGSGSENVETSVRKALREPEKQYKNSLGLAPFVVEDEKYNYISARFPPDAQLLAEKVTALVKEIHQE